MSLQQFKDWYQAHGVRRVSALLSPDPVPLKNLSISSTFHYLGSSQASLPDPSDPLFAGYTSKIALHSVMDYPEQASGFTSKRTLMIQQETLKFCNKNTKFSLMRNLNVNLLGAQQLAVINYGFLDDLYKYPQIPESQFNRYRNKLLTFVSVVTELNKNKPRNNYVILTIPRDLVSKNTLDQFSLKPIKQVARIFDTEEKVLLRELWLWANPTTRDKSVFSGLSETDMKTINFMYRTSTGEYEVVNFGYLYSWIKGSNNLTFGGTVLTVPYVELQKYWLKNMMTMHTIDEVGASVDEQEAVVDELAVKVEDDAKEVPDPGARFPEEANAQLGDGISVQAGRPVNGKNGARRGKHFDETIDTDAKIAQQLKDLDADMEALDQLDKRRNSSKFTVQKDEDGDEMVDIKDVEVDTYVSDVPETKEAISARIFTSKTAEQAVISKLDAATDEGRISGSEYRKLIEMAKKASLAPDPYGSGKTIAHAMKITQEDLDITPEESKLVIPPAALQPSLGYSSLKALNKKYNSSIIYKDMLRSVQAVQKAGVIIRSHEVETKTSILGTYDIHTIEIKPINGQPSIIRARLPKVDEEGLFRAKGNLYSLRGQITDRPIRRIGTNRVGLTSYYGKSFVDRSAKKSESYLEFIFKRLNKATIEPSEFLRDVSPGDVFDNYFEAPYIYSGLSSKFRSFRAGQYLFNLNHKDREKATSPELLAKLEVNGRRLIGQGPGSNPLVVDPENNFFLITSSGEKAVGDIFDILQLDRTDAPVDFAEVKVFSKGVPVGIFLGQNLGFRALVKYLGARHRLVERRQQKKLQPYEYAVQFKDVSYIFDRRDGDASLILAGFNTLEKEIKQYEAKEFDAKPVYGRLMEAMGLTSIYTKEMENLNDLFVDPITEDLLKELGEPQTFMGLLVRSCEMLKTYHHPASQDMNFQRFRGYERFAGFMYKEMVSSIRAFKAKNSTGRSRVDMSPFAVWAAVTRDSSVKHAENINPIQALKASESLTYVGEGGRSKESMNKESRALHVSNLGIVSLDASVDSSDVGINVFTSADPGISSVRGMGKKGRNLDPANLFGTSTLLAPFSTHDDQFGSVSMKALMRISSNCLEPT